MQKSLKIVAVSDTHSNFSQFQQIYQQKIKGDIFIHAGDFTRYGREEHFRQFFNWIQKLDFKHKIVISGNHEISLDQNMPPRHFNKFRQKYNCRLNRATIIEQLKKRCIYLEHDMVEIEGLNIFGSPYTQYYSKGAFQYPLKNDELIWNTLPPNIDILITHGPPLGILDICRKTENVGSPNLRKKVFEIKPRLHVFGHIHQSHGIVQEQGITFMNVAKQFQIFRWN